MHHLMKKPSSRSVPKHIQNTSPRVLQPGYRHTRAPNMFVPPKALRPNVKVDKNKLERRLNRQEDWLKRTGRLREFLPNEYEEVVKVGDKLDKRLIDKSALIAPLGTVTTLT